MIMIKSKICQLTLRFSMPSPSGSHEDSYYRRLDIGRDASHDDIVSAYRRMAMAAHPDAHPEDPGAAGRFREISEAYEVLGDPSRRAVYDRRVLGPSARVHDVAPGNRVEVGDHLEGPVVALGETRRLPRGDAPLRAGPVHVDRAPGRGLGDSEPWTWDLDDVLHRMLRTWWSL